jgi:signal transduction histidine kinase
MSETLRPSLVGETLRALVVARRAVPLALVGGALLVAEWLASRSPGALVVDTVQLAVFVVCAPALWRALFARTLRGAGDHAVAWALYAVASLVAVGGVSGLLPPLFDVRWTYVGDPRSLGVLVVLFLVGGWGLGRDIELEAGLVRERARAERLAIDAEHAQILALRAQLDPHFLFNTLNAIAEWCREDPLVAERATLDLAALLRSVFDALQTPGWSLGREISLLERLAALYGARDASRFRFQFTVDSATAAREVPPLVLLPLFENAIKHGPAAGHDGAVTLQVRAEGDAAIVTIENPGTFAGRREGGRGLASVERRLALAYGADVRPMITSTPLATTTVVSIPRLLAGGPS